MRVSLYLPVLLLVCAPLAGTSPPSFFHELVQSVAFLVLEPLLSHNCVPKTPFITAYMRQILSILCVHQILQSFVTPLPDWSHQAKALGYGQCRGFLSQALCIVGT